jgi:uroporphyrinogen-III synthase
VISAVRVLLTRPRAQADPLARTLRGRGYEVRIEPMLAVVFLDGVAPDLDGVAAILFTSANGVRAFARRSSCRERAVFAVGDATAAAAREAGFANVESAAGDVASLAALVAERLDPAAGTLLHVSGRSVAGDLAGDLEGRGFALRRAVLYRTEPAREFSPGLKKSLARGHLDVVLFFSPRTAAAFVEGVARAGLSRTLGGLTALCLSEAVAGRLRGFGWRRVEVAERLDAVAMLDRLDRLRGGAPAHETEAGGTEKGGTEKGMTETTAEEAGATPEPSAAQEEKAEEEKAEDAPRDSEEAPARPRRRGRIFLWVLILLLLAGGGALLFGTKEGKDWLAELPLPQLDLSWLQTELAGLQSEPAGSQPELAGPQPTALDAAASERLEARIERLESTVQEIRSTADTSEQAGEPFGERIDAVTKRLDTLDNLLNELQFTLANSAVAPAGGGEAMAERLSGLEKRLDKIPGIEQQLARIEAEATAQKAAMEAMEKTAPAGGGEAMAERLSGLEKRLEKIPGIEQQLARIEAEATAQKAAMEAMEKMASAGGGEAMAERLSGLEKRLEKISGIEQQLARIETEAAAQKAAMEKLATEQATTEQASRATARAQGANSFLLAAARLRQVLEGEGPFADELAALRRVAGDDPAVRRLLAPLEAHAETGIADHGTLRRRFEAAAREVMSTRVGNESSGAAAQEVEDPGMLSRALANVTSFVRVRRIGEATATPEERETAGRIDDARRALAEGDLGAAAHALERLPAAPAAAFTGWLSEARARLAAGRNGSALLSLATERATVTRGPEGGSPGVASAPAPAVAP